MEQTVIDFFSKSSELILHNRITAPKTLESALNQITNLNPWKFQIRFLQKFNLNAKIPAQWSSHSNKLLVLEFFLRSKSSNEKFLVEQWVFELNQVSDGRVKDTIDSANTLYKRLSTLMRTLSVLSVTLPLYKSFINDKNNQFKDSFFLEHSVNFSRHTLANWHPSIHEDKNFASFTNPDFVIPGRTFSFKVNYSKSLNFLASVLEDSGNFDQEQQLRTLKEKLLLNHFAPKKQSYTLSEEASIAIRSIRKSTADTNKANGSLGANTPPKDSLQKGSYGVSDNASPLGSILTSSPIETQRSPKEGRSRRNSGGYPWEGRSSAGNRARIGTINSENSVEYDMYIYEDKEGKFTEVLSMEEIQIRDESPARFSIHPKLGEDEEFFMEISKGIEEKGLKLSTNIKPIEKIIEQNDDDKIAELIQVIEELKDHYDVSYSMKDQSKAQERSLRNTKSYKEPAKALSSVKGLLFHSGSLEVGENEKSSTVSLDYASLGELYSSLRNEK